MRSPAVYGWNRLATAGCAQYVPEFSATRFRLGIAQGVFDAPLGYLVLAVDALGIDPEQHGNAVPGPLGDLGGRNPAVEPRGDARMPVMWNST